MANPIVERLHTLVFASFLLTGGALDDRFGVKRVFMAAADLEFTWLMLSSLCG